MTADRETKASGFSQGDLWALVLSGVAMALALAMIGPIAQDSAYHQFADQRKMWGIPNALDVLSNVPFVVVGILGLGRAMQQRLRGPLWLNVILFAGVTLTGFGSGYYHWAPTDASLVWDRLPMTIVFGSLFSLVLHDRVSARLGQRLALPLLVAGPGSVLWWQQTGDLRPYAWIQFFPLVAILWILARSRVEGGPRRPLLQACVAYGAAKLFEAQDRAIFELSLSCSGHTLKHLAAAFATACFLSWRRSMPRAPQRV